LFTSSPSRIVRTAIVMFAEGSILVDMQVSGFEFVVGYGAAIIIGVPLGILMGWYSRVDAVLDPFVSALYATPRIALLPLVMIWFGIGLMSKVAIVFLGAIFPILVNTITGVRTVNADFVKVARSFGSNDWQMFLTVVLPSANISMAVRTIRLGELVNSGLTHPRSTEASQNARNTSMEIVPSSACSCRAQNVLGGPASSSSGGRTEAVSGAGLGLRDTGCARSSTRGRSRLVMNAPFMPPSACRSCALPARSAAKCAARTRGTAAEA
jgi:hypothetical protein